MSPASVIPPDFITVLRARDGKPTAQPSMENTSESNPILLDHPTSEQQVPHSTDNAFGPQLPTEQVELHSIDWDAWDRMIEDFELNAGGSLY